MRFQVTEHYSDGSTDPFGYQELAYVPAPGDTVTLHWLEGDVAFDAVVLGVDSTALQLHVRRTEDVYSYDCIRQDGAGCEDQRYYEAGDGQDVADAEAGAGSAVRDDVCDNGSVA